jgi:hypothetical protein
VHRSQSDPKFFDEDESKHVLLSNRARLALPEGHGRMSGSVVSGRSGTDGNEKSYPGSAISGATSKGRRRRDDGKEGEEPGQYEFGTSTHNSIVNGLVSSSKGSVTGHSQIGRKIGGGKSIISGTSYKSGASNFSSTSSRVTAVKRQIGKVLELSEVDAMGNPIDGYDYNSHFSSISGSGIFVTRSGELMKSSALSVLSSRSKRSITRGDNNLVDNDDIGDSASVGWGPASIVDDAIDAVITTHEAARRVNLPLDVLPAVPEFEDDQDDEIDGTVKKPQLAALSLLPESLPADIKRVLDLVESIDVDNGEFEFTEEDWALDADEIMNDKLLVESDKNNITNIVDPTSSPSLSSSSSVSIAAKPSKAHVNLKRAAVGVEELDDNFVMQALGAEPIPRQDGEEINEEDEESTVIENTTAGMNKNNKSSTSSSSTPFDFDAHIAKLMARAEGQWVDTNELYDNREDDEDEDDDDDDENEVSENTKVVRAPFLADASGRGRIGESALSAMLANYDDELIGELDDDPLIHQDGFQPVDTNDEEEEEEEEEAEEDIPRYRGLGFKRNTSRKVEQEEEENEEEEEEENEFDDDEEEEEEDGAFRRPLMTASAFLEKAMDDFEREKSERHMYQGRGRTVENKKGKKAIGSTWEEEEEEEGYGKKNINRDIETTSTVAVSITGTTSEPISSSLTTPPSTTVNSGGGGGGGGFTVKIGLLSGNKKPVVSSAVSTTGSFQTITTNSNILSSDDSNFVRPPSPVSASAAIAVKVAMGRMHGILGAMGGIGDMSVNERNLVQGNSGTTTTSTESHLSSSSNVVDKVSNEVLIEQREIPFGWAEGDIADATDADMFPKSWSIEPSKEPKWDVHTIISTYSNTDNHPCRLDDGVSITTSKRGSLGPRIIGLENTTSGVGGVDNGKEESGGDSLVNSLIPGLSTLRLSRKTGMPMKQRDIMTVVSEVEEVDDGGKKLEKKEKEKEEEEEEDDDEDKDSDDDNDQSIARFQRRRGETTEERKARKAVIKAERRERRADKKGLKVAYKIEILRQQTNVLRLDSLARGTTL